MAAGKGVPTITDVARRAATTVATVSRVINNSGYVSQERRAAVEAAIRELGYVPNANARALVTRRSKTIGVVIGDFLNPYAIQLAATVRNVAAEQDYVTFVATAAEDPASELQVIDAFHRQRVAGLVLATLPTPESDDMVRRMVAHGLPVVLVGRTLDDAAVDAISSNFRRGGYLATRHLLDLGHKRIAFVGAALAEADRVTRLRGYVDALEEAKVPVRPEYVVGSRRAQPTPRYSTQLTGYQATQELLKLPTRPTAIFARNDVTALGVLQALREKAIRVPEEMSVAGFDDVPLARQMVPALTTVSQPTDQQGQLAAEFLLRRIEPGGEGETLPARRIMLECNLIVRASTGPRPPR